MLDIFFLRILERKVHHLRATKYRLKKKGGDFIKIKKNKKENSFSTQDWLNILEILDNGIIKLKDNKYLKIIKIKPINFNLKSDLEKEAILNSYKIFLKTCNFNFQILIQSNKEDLSNHFSKINNNLNLEEKNIQEISKKYIDYIKELNNNKKSSSKNYYIIINYENKNNEIVDVDTYATEDLNNKYFKIKECLSRCGNMANDIIEKEQLINILFSFFNTRIYFNNK